MKAEDEKYFVSLGMRTYGGSFVKCLGEALSHSDWINDEKIKIAFPEYWEQYLKMGKEVEK